MQLNYRNIFWRLACAGSLVFSLVLPASYCQSNAGTPPQQSTAQAAVKSSDLLHPALSRVSQTITGLNISRWKAPGEVRSATQQNIDLIQRDLNGTLAGLLATADATPDQVSAVFPVYRNIDALYDVLLRVSQTADLAAPQNESASVTDALHQLESARTDLGNNILTLSKNSEAETVKLRATIQQATAAAQAAAAAPAKTTVVNDGPAKTTAKKKKKPAPAPATQQTPPPQ